MAIVVPLAVAEALAREGVEFLVLSRSDAALEIAVLRHPLNVSRLVQALHAAGARPLGAHESGMRIDYLYKAKGPFDFTTPAGPLTVRVVWEDEWAQLSARR